MSYLGNTPANQAFTPQVDYFSGNASTTAFTLSRPVASVAQVEAVIENVAQNPSSAYTVSGNTITFTSAPPSGTNNIYVRYTSPITQVIAPGQGTVGATQITNASITPAKLSTGAPSWDTSGNLTNTGTGSFQGVYIGKGAAADATSTAIGNGALTVNSSGYYNTAVGYQTLFKNTGGYLNNAFGRRALYNNLTGNENIAVGGGAMFSNTSGSANTAIGSEALQANTEAKYMTAVGYQAGYSHTGGEWNGTFVGYAAGYNSTGASNTLIGSQAGFLITTGSKNTILGRYDGNSSGLDIRTASNNIVLSDGDGNPRGYFNSNGYLSIGTRNYSGYGNACLSVEGGTSQAMVISVPNQSTDVISCWNQATAANPNLISFYTEGTPTARGSIYYNRGANQIVYGVSSDVRLKENIVDAPSALEKITSVKIRSFDWKETGTHTDFGVIAQELVTVAPEAVVEGAENIEEAVFGGKQYWQVDTSVLVPAMIKAIQEQQALITSLTARIEALESK